MAADTVEMDERLKLAAQTVRSYGQQLSREVMTEMKAVYAPLQKLAPDGLGIERDLAYGDHPRQLLNLFMPADEAEETDILLFVHGGGFVSGDKEEDPGIFYDNVGLWAAGRGLLGVTMNYRLAPEYGWPSGLEDVASAVDWLSANTSRFHGNRNRIFVLGHSAGAAHVAAHIAQAGTHVAIAGAICLSGMYDLAPPASTAYFGEDRSLDIERSPIHGLAASETPLLVLVAEFDPAPICGHFTRFLSACDGVRGRLPNFGQIRGHNHFSAILHVNSPDEALGEEILCFIETTRTNEATPRKLADD